MPLSFLKIFSELEQAEREGVLIRYAVGGAIAATYYLEAIETEGVDVFCIVDPRALASLDPFRGAYDWFRSRGATWRDEHLVIDGWALHLLPSTGPLVDDALEHPTRVLVDGQPVNLLAWPHLAAIALETNRPKDRVRLAMMWSEDDFDRAAFLSLVARYSLSERWSKLLPLLEEVE